VIQERGTNGTTAEEYSAAFKAQIALAAIRGDCTQRTGGQARRASDPHQQLEDPPCSPGPNPSSPAAELTADERPEPAELFEQIGRLKMEPSGQKKLRTVIVARALIDETHPASRASPVAEVAGVESLLLLLRRPPPSHRRTCV